MKRNIITAGFLSALSLSSFAQETPKFNSDIEVKAVVDAGCFLTAENINFGVLQMPLNDQSATSSIKVQCSKGANLQLAIAYNSQGQIYGGNYTVSRYTQNTAAEWVKVDKDGQRISTSAYDIRCHKSYPNQVNIYNKEIQTLLNASTIQAFIPDEWGICSGAFANYDAIIAAIGGGVSGGALAGLSSSEKINYFLTVPNSNNTWGGNTQYELLATGVEQTIPMKANIKRADNPTYRMTPDTYQSTLTVVLTY